MNLNPSCNDGSDSENLLYVGSSNGATIEPCGPLPSPEWMSNVRTLLQKWSSQSLETESEPVAEIKCPEITPHICDSINGDGNCLFRAISKETTGTQKNHGVVQEAIINFMAHPQNTQAFGALLFPQSPNVESALHKVTTYIDTSKMCQDKTWGIEKEITVAVTLFQVDIQ